MIVVAAVVLIGLSIGAAVFTFKRQEREMQAAAMVRQNAVQAAGLVKQLINAETAQVPGIVVDLGGYRQWSDPLLRQENFSAPAARF
jgi:hypothetical protein